LTSLGGIEDVSLADTVRLTYKHTDFAEHNILALSVNSPANRRISGFTSPKVRAVDITDPANIQELATTVTAQTDGTYAVDFRVAGASAAQAQQLFIFAEVAAAMPDTIKPNYPSTWSANTNAADYLIITNRDFIAQLQPLVQLRHSTGLSVDVIDVEDLYDEFTFGLHSPQAIRTFLQRAASSWQRKPHFVLLVGDSSYDPKNYFGQGLNDLVPTKLIDTLQLETASDDWLADVDGDGVADLAIGRLPAGTAADALVMVNKIINYENRPSDPQRGILLVADRGFEAASNSVQSLLPPGLPVQTINRSNSDDSTVHAEVVEGINQEPRLTNYFGHGSNGVWTSAPLLSNLDAPSLTNTKHLSVFTMMTCFNGYFQDAVNDSLSEALLKSQGGAVAVWASSSLTEPAGQRVIDQEFYRQIFGPQAPALGDAVRAAKQTASDLDVRRTWILFGDPAMRLRVQSPTAAPATIRGTIASPDGRPLGGVTMHMTGATSATAITDGFGNYRFYNIPSDNFYVLTPSLANFRFSPESRSFSLLASMTDALFTAVPDSVARANAIDASEFFVRQQYLDFLAREPDLGGFNYWTEQVSQCSGAADCTRIKRIDVSAAFFRSQEFHDTGLFVYCLYAGALGRTPAFAEFISDRGKAVGGPGLEQARSAVLEEFVNRPEFAAKYPPELSREQFVDSLLQIIRQRAGIGAPSLRGVLLSAYNSGGRAAAVRAGVGAPEFVRAQYNQAFVQMEYFGYLRRDPDRAGYDFWLNVLNKNDSGNYRDMVCSFITSAEYQRRFGPVITRSNAECGR
jgi:hypothetical protein